MVSGNLVVDLRTTQLHSGEFAMWPRSRLEQLTGTSVFQVPWQRIVSSIESTASSHEQFAQKIENDVEKPLRQFQARDSEMKAATNSQNNLASIAKELSAAQKKAEKARGGKKEGGASSGVDDASRQWESQAPVVFEQLQAVDERRVNHLRDVLTQLQTHEADQVERQRATAESCLNTLLNLETADEIKTFAEKIKSGRSSLYRSSVAADRPATAGVNAPPMPPPPRQSDMARRLSSTSGPDRSAAASDPTPTKSKLGGLKRLGTVMGRRKSAMPPPPTPEKKKDRRSMMPFRRGDSSRSFQDLEESGRDLTPITSQEPTNRLQSIDTTSREEAPSQQATELPAPVTNGSSEYQPPPGPPPSHLATDTTSTTAAAQEQAVPSAPIPAVQAPQQESSLPSSLQPRSIDSEVDDGTRGFAIRDQPIKEDESEAQLAMSNMANQLRMQGQTSGINRMQGSVRGRRDVRNTMFIPGGLDVMAAGNQIAPAQSPPLAASSSATDLASPIQPPRQKTIHEDHALGSDAGSIHSSHSLAGLAHHPELHDPGLNVSIVETVNSWFSETGITKSFVTGEVALAYNPNNTTTSTPETESIRLQHFELLEKVAANPMFVSSPTRTSTTTAEDHAGTYTLALTHIKRPSPTVGLKYQLHLEPDNLAAYSPILLTPAWQLIDSQASVIVLYSLNPVFAVPDPTSPLTLRNVSITVSLDTTSSPENPKPTAAMMAPTAGASFRRKAGTVTWKFPELSVKSEQERLLVRFTTGPGMPKKGAVEVKFELQGRTGSVVGVERRVEGAGKARERDPFADDDGSAGAGTGLEDGGEGEGVGWEDMGARRCLVSGRYSAA